MRALILCVAACAASFTGRPADAQNLLGNPGFEAPEAGGVEFAGAGDDWTVFGSGIFTQTIAIAPVQTGIQSLKLFGGCCSGAFQQFPINPGETANGSVWIQNFSGDQMAAGQVAAVNIEWIQADGVTQSSIIPFISNGTFTAESTVDEWTEQTITGVAPDDAAFARFVLITGDFAEGGPGGAPFYDDAFFEILGPEVPLVITDFSLVDGMFTLTWDSVPDAIYTVRSSLDLINWDGDINDNVPSDGDTTSIDFEHPAPQLDEIFFRVEENVPN